MADKPKHPMRFPWEQMRADVEAGSVATWDQLGLRYNCSTESIRKRRIADAKAGSPWPSLNASKTAVPQQQTNVLPFARSSPARGPAAGVGPQSRQPAPRQRRAALGSLRRDDGGDESLLDRDEPPLDGETQLDGNLAGQPITAGLLDQVIHGIARKLIRGKVKPSPYQSQADVWNLGMDAIKKASMLQREIAGKKSGQPSVPGEDATKPKTLRFVVADEESSEAG